MQLLAPAPGERMRVRLRFNRRIGMRRSHLGSYTRAAETWLEGSYLTLRPSFKDDAQSLPIAQDTSGVRMGSICNSARRKRLDHDYTQFDLVSVPHQSGHIYLVTNRMDRCVVVVAGRPTIRGEMHGLLTTLRSDRGAHLSPVFAADRVSEDQGRWAPPSGVITEDHAEYARYRALIRSTLDDGFASCGWWGEFALSRPCITSRQRGRFGRGRFMSAFPLYGRRVFASLTTVSRRPGKWSSSSGRSATKHRVPVLAVVDHARLRRTFK